MTLHNWIDSVNSQGRYVFTAAEAATSSGLTKESARKALSRLSKLLEPRMRRESAGTPSLLPKGRGPFEFSHFKQVSL